MTNLRISEAAEYLGVSDDTVRRWIDSGRLRATNEKGPTTVSGRDVAHLMRAASPDMQPRTASARNSFPGIVIRVERDRVMALVEVQAGRYRVTSLMSREAADELGLEPGVRAVASVKATNVVIELP